MGDTPRVIKGQSDFVSKLGNVEGSSSVEVGRYVRSIQGSFHQGDQRFERGGLQCMAISLAALAKHRVESVLSWQSRELDEVLVAGDRLYRSLWDSGRVRGSYRMLCVPDLPPQSVIDGHTFEFEYGDFVSGFVDSVEVDEEFIRSGLVSTLRDGLGKMCSQYDTCLQ